MTFLEGEAEDLPFPDGSFEAVLSAGEDLPGRVPRHSAAELLRVCRPGGRIGMVHWAPEGYVGQLFAAIGRHRMPQSLEAPVAPGGQERLRALFGPAVAITAPRRSLLWRFPSAEHQVAFFASFHGPTTRALQALGPDRAGALKAELLEVARRVRRVRGRHAGAAARLPGGRGPQAGVAVGPAWTRRWSTAPTCP